MFRNKETCPEFDNLQYKKRYCILRMYKQQVDGTEGDEMGIENKLSQMCAMIESGKLSYADAVYYLNLMREKYGIWEKEFRQVYDVWSEKGELNWLGDKAGEESDESYQRILDGLYEMVEVGEMTLEMVTENLWEDAYEIKKDPCRGYAGFYPELPGCIGYGKDKNMLRENMKKSLTKWICAGYEQWRERWIMNGCEELEGLF